jgi:ParB-like chromosome segregation protein Spo0J
MLTQDAIREIVDKKGTRILNSEVELVSADDIRPHPRNPRHGNLEVIAESIAENGFYGFCVVQKSTGWILAGNHRFRAATEICGFSEVPVVWIDCDDATAAKILVADNRTSDVAVYDNEQLTALLHEFSAGDGLVGTGFDDDDLANLDATLEEWEQDLGDLDLEDEDLAEAKLIIKCHIDERDEVREAVEGVLIPFTTARLE